MTRMPQVWAALRRPLLAAAMMVVGSSAAYAQQTKIPPDTTKKSVPATKTGAPPATKTGAPPVTKTVTPPPVQTKVVTPPVTKTVTPPPVQTKAVTPPPQQTKAPATAPQQVKTSPQANKTAQPPAGRGAPASRPNVVTTDTAVAKPLAMMREAYDYDGNGRRDPFLSLLTTTDLRPTISDLKLLMTVVDEPGRSVGLVYDSHIKKQQSIRVGSRLGRMRVTSIRADAVIFTIEEFGMNRRDSLLLRDSTKVRGR